MDKNSVIKHHLNGFSKYSNDYLRKILSSDSRFSKIGAVNTNARRNLLLVLETVKNLRDLTGGKFCVEQIQMIVTDIIGIYPTIGRHSETQMPFYLFLNYESIFQLHGKDGIFSNQ